MLSDGHIGRMAVLAEHRAKGTGKQLLTAITARAIERQYFEVYLHAQKHAVPFYESAGFSVDSDEFMDAGIPHFTMRRQLAPQRLLGVHSGKFRVDSMAASACELIPQAERQLRILSFDLDREVFEQAALIQAISELARKSRFSEISILICDSDKIVNRGHQLLSLQQRLNSAIKIRKFELDSEDIKDKLIIADSLGIICQSIREPELSWGNYNNRPVAEDYIAQFNRIWARAKPDPNLRPVSL